jgi:crossover junction endodeoxyribonuclease RuvC
VSALDRAKGGGRLQLRQKSRLHRGCPGARAVPISFITPAHWKRLVGIPRGKEAAKDAAKSEVISRWPDKAAMCARVKDDGRAESALIAIAGLLREARQ